MPSPKEADGSGRGVARVELLWAQGREVRVGERTELAGKRVLCGFELRVAVKEGDETGGLGIEAELALAGFEGDRSDGQRSGGAIIDGDVDLCGGLQIGAEGRGNGHLVKVEQGAVAGHLKMADGAADLLAGAVAIVCFLQTHEGWLVMRTARLKFGTWPGARVMRTRSMGRWAGTRKSARVSWPTVGDAAGAEGGGVERLGFAAGWDRRSLERCRKKGCAALQRRERDVEQGCGGFLQVQGGVCGKVFCT